MLGDQKKRCAEDDDDRPYIAPEAERFVYSQSGNRTTSGLLWKAMSDLIEQQPIIAKMDQNISGNERKRRRRSSRDPEGDRECWKDDSYRKRRGHRATDSAGELLPRNRDINSRKHEYSSDSSPRKQRRGGGSRGKRSNPLSLDSLAALDAQNAKRGWKGYDEAYLREVRQKETRMERERRKAEQDLERERRRALGQAEIEQSCRLENEARIRAVEPPGRSSGGERKERGKERLAEDTQAQKRMRDRDRNGDDVERRRAEYRSERSSRKDQPRQLHARARRVDYGANGDSEEAEEDYTDSEETKERPYPADRRPHVDYREPYRDRRSFSRHYDDDYTPQRKSNRRVISGPLMEEGGTEKTYGYRRKSRKAVDSVGSSSIHTKKKRPWKSKGFRKICFYVSAFVAALAIIISVAVVVAAKKNSNANGSDPSSGGSKPANNNLNGISENDIPPAARGTYLDPFTWYDTDDFNVTYTDATVGGLPIMGLNSTWDDGVQANPNVPALHDPFPYGKMPIRGMNLGGWLSIEPFITPSLFAGFSSSAGVVDEWTLSEALGSRKASETIEPHYSSFVSAQTFADIRAAGFDHVRIPFSYWAVTTYDGDPYVRQTSFRYLLRGLEWARQNGLRVNLDLHGLPGSQNGWNHSGRQGLIGWLNGTDGDLNGQRSLDIHNQLSQFFAQPRYQNLVTMYGLVNEPRMTALDTNSVLNWTANAINIVRKNNITAVIVFGDGFLGLQNWQGKLQNYDNILLDAHQYVIFNNDQIALDHSDKLNFACKGWTQQMRVSMNKATGFGPTLCGEWSQADTDCATYLNDVGVGSRWEGTMNTGNATTSVLSPQCPTKNNPVCECTDANAHPNSYSAAYKQWLLQFAQAQMESFEQGWGWFYWTWLTENAVQWSWQLGSEAGILPKTALPSDRTFNCNDTIPDFAGMGLAENY